MTTLLSDYCRRFWNNYRATASYEAEMIGTLFDTMTSKALFEFDHELIWC